ncbi:hypothetical protein CBS9595_002336 [Malassezia furfur]|nr:hypothetical protein CBS9595_002336 [Malassezia furfur]
MFGVMQLAKRIPFEENPDYVTYARIGYLAAQLACLAVYYFCSIQIKKKNDLTVLKYVNAKNPMEPGELVTTTNRDYDLAEVSKSVRGILMGMGIVALMHFYFGYTNPLVIQSLIPFKNALESNMAKIWIWGVPATGELKRPFKPAPGLFSSLTENNGPQTEKAAVKEAETPVSAIQAKAE